MKTKNDLRLSTSVDTLRKVIDDTRAELRRQTTDRVKEAEKIVGEFESIFGQITATERRWLTRRISGQEV